MIVSHDVYSLPLVLFVGRHENVLFPMDADQNRDNQRLLDSTGRCVYLLPHMSPMMCNSLPLVLFVGRHENVLFPMDADQNGDNQQLSDSPGRWHETD